MTRMTPRVLVLETALQYTFINEELLSSEARFFFFFGWASVESTSVLSDSMNLTLLGILCKWNHHTVFALHVDGNALFSF